MAKAAAVAIWMPIYVGDHVTETSRLALEQHGAYIRLMLDYWRSGPPPDDDAILATIVRAQLSQWRKLRPVLSAFFIIADGVWRHAQLDAALISARERQTRAEEKARNAAENRWRKSTSCDATSNAADDATSNAHSTARSNAKSTATSNDEALHEDMHGLCPSPSPSPEVPNPPYQEEVIGRYGESTHASEPADDNPLDEPDDLPPVSEKLNGRRGPDTAKIAAERMAYLAATGR